MVRHLRAIAWDRIGYGCFGMMANVTACVHSQRTARTAHSELLRRRENRKKPRTLLASAVIAGPLFLLAFRLFGHRDLWWRILFLLG